MMSGLVGAFVFTVYNIYFFLFGTSWFGCMMIILHAWEGFLTAWHRGENERGSSMMCSNMGIRNSPKCLVMFQPLTVCFISKSYMQL